MTGGIGFNVEGSHEEDGIRIIDKARATSFNATLTKEGSDLFDDMLKGTGPVEIVMYGPADLPWYRDWYWRLRERFFGDRYPEAVIASGKAYMDGTIIDDGTRVHGTFRAAGKWEVK